LFGRDILFEQAQERLTRQPVLGITGMTGIGKSVFAAQLAQAYGTRTHRITLTEQSPVMIEELIWQLAQPLFVSEPHLQELLEQLRTAAYAPIARLHYVLAAYARQPEPLLICIDQAEHATLPDMRALLIALCDYVAHTHAAQIVLLIVGRELPYKLRPYLLPAFTGLTMDAIQTWAQERGFMLAEQELHTITERTGGLPLAIEQIWRTLEQSPELTPERVLTTRDVRLLAPAIIGLLPISAQHALAQLAIRPQLPSNPEQLHDLQILEAHHLVNVAATAITLHPFIQYYYQQSLFQ
jgi:hypothetical protein